MNGRIYEPRLGRMLSPDPVTQAPENGQNYNRYSYAYNNPLKYVDPSGFVVAECAVACPLIKAFLQKKFRDMFFGGNGCSLACQLRKDSIDYCETSSTCQEVLEGKKGRGQVWGAQINMYLLSQKGDNVVGGNASQLNEVVDEKLNDRVQTARGLLYNYKRGLGPRSPDRIADLAYFVYQNDKTEKYVLSETFYQVDPGRGLFGNRLGLGNANWNDKPPDSPRGTSLSSIVILQHNYRWDYSSQYQDWADTFQVVVVVDFMRPDMETQWFLPTPKKEE